MSDDITDTQRLEWLFKEIKQDNASVAIVHKLKKLGTAIAIGADFRQAIDKTMQVGDDVTKAGSYALLPGSSDPKLAACLGSWLMFCPGCHPFWSYWIASLIHLRHVDGLDDPNIEVPNMTHELIVAALDPEFPPPRLDDLDWAKSVHRLSPLDHVIQFEAASDQVAIAVMEALCTACAAGNLSPDQDYRMIWKEVVPGLAKDLSKYVNDSKGKDDERKEL